MKTALSNIHAKRPSAVSQVLRVVEDGSLETARAALPGACAALRTFSLRAANNREMRESAYRLAYEAYHRKGYIPEEAAGLLANRFDALPDTVTLLALERHGERRTAGTLSMMFDSSLGLPSDEIFRDEVDSLRHSGRWLVEVCRLAISDAHANSRDLLALFCSVPASFAMRVRGFTDLLLEVNPRHVPFYRRLLKFEILGSERPCPRVNGAPAVLLRIDLLAAQAELQRLRTLGPECKERCLYQHFLNTAEEQALIQELASAHRPMTVDEMRYFKLERALSLGAHLTRVSA